MVYSFQARAVSRLEHLPMLSVAVGGPHRLSIVTHMNGIPRTMSYIYMVYFQNLDRIIGHLELDMVEEFPCSVP